MADVTHHNCYIALDTRTGKVLASVECKVTGQEETLAIKFYGLDQTFKAFRAATANLYGIRQVIDAHGQAYDYLLRNWKLWVPEKGSRYITVQLGGGSYWPHKVLGKRRWHKEGNYSFEYDQIGDQSKELDS